MCFSVLKGPRAIKLDNESTLLVILVRIDRCQAADCAAGILLTARALAEQGYSLLIRYFPTSSQDFKDPWGRQELLVGGVSFAPPAITHPYR